jgi:hypothetical protein
MSLRRKYETEGGTKDLLNALDVTLIRYRFPLRRGLTVNLWFPEDMTEAEANGVPKGLPPTSKSYAGQVVDIYRPGLWQWDWYEPERTGEHLDSDS